MSDEKMGGSAAGGAGRGKGRTDGIGTGKGRTDGIGKAGGMAVHDRDPAEQECVGIGGLDLAERYYREVGRPAFEREMPELLPRIAAGLAGEGSECFGWDDELSRDHDFGPSFCVWLTDEDFAAYGEKAEEIYRSLPGDFLGVPARRVMPHGADRVGVMPMSRFWRKFTGLADLPGSDREWLRIPEHFLAQATNGRVFEDGPGRFTRIREGYRKFYPEEVRRKKMAARAVKMAQSGQYNYPRSLRRGESGAAFLALSEFLQADVSMAHLLSRRYTPYYKWMFRSFRSLPLFEDERADVEEMIRRPLDPGNVPRIEKFCEEVVRIWKRQGLTDSSETFLEPQGWQLYRRIESPELRDLSIFEG